jgi:hypothetical protein
MSTNRKGMPGETNENPKQDFKQGQRALISFESGHYKTIKGDWKGDSVWTHFKKKDGGMVHVNKEKVEYIETWPL